jgi:lysophospholipase
MTYHIETFPCENGNFMRWARLDAPKQPSKGCVLIGVGWGEWLEKYAPVAEEWRKRGYDCAVLEWRGQGLSSRMLSDRLRGHHNGFEPLIEDLDAFINWYFENDPGPVYLMGHSMGAHLLLRWYLEREPTMQIIKGIILMSPMQEINTEPFRYKTAEMIARVATAFGMGKRYAPGQKYFDPAEEPFLGNKLSHDENRYMASMLALRDNPMLKSGGLTFGWLNTVFKSTKKLDARIKLGAPKGPYLVVGPQHDPLVETRAMKRIAAYLPNCTSAFYLNAGHELLFETDAIRKEVWKAIDNFMSKN